MASLADGAARAIPSLIFDAAALPSAVQLPAPETRAVFDFGGMIRLDGYVLDVDRSASRRIQVSLHWTALRQSPEDYTLFAHLLDDRDQIVAQWDSQPLDGDYPTSWWQPGEEVLDRRAWALSNSVPAGDYRLALGLYRAPDGPRLPVRDVGNQVQSHERILIEVSLPEAGE